jgi:hypothetical protein
MQVLDVLYNMIAIIIHEANSICMQWLLGFETKKRTQTRNKF